MRLRHKWFERSDLNPSRKCFELGGLVFSRSDSLSDQRKRMKVSRCKQARESAREGLCSLSLSQHARYHKRSSHLPALINHMNRSNTALAGQKFVLAAAKKKFNAGKTLFLWPLDSVSINRFEKLRVINLFPIQLWWKLRWFRTLHFAITSSMKWIKHVHILYPKLSVA